MPIIEPQYPVNLVLTGRRCLVVGGGKVAVRKAQGLLACGAVVDVIAMTVSDAMRELPVTVIERAYQDGDVQGYRLVVTATGDMAIDRSVFEDAERHDVWVNAADEPSACSFTLPAVTRRGPLMVTVSTGGHSPALATWLRDHVNQEMGPEYGALVLLLSNERERIKSAGGSTEDVDWNRVLRGNVLEFLRAGDVEQAAQRLRELLDDKSRLD